MEPGSSPIIWADMGFRLQVHDAVLIPPRRTHLCEPEDPGRFRFRLISLAPGWVWEAFGADPVKMPPASATLSRKDLAAKTAFFDAMAAEEPDAMKSEEEVVFFVGRLLALFNAHAPAPENPGGSETARQVKAFLDTHFDGDIQLKDLECEFGRSRFSLLRQFRSAFGLTPHAYLVNQRINAAKKCLLEDHSVADTAVRCGFFDQSHFVKTFLNYVGMTPAWYQQKGGPSKRS